MLFTEQNTCGFAVNIVTGAFKLLVEITVTANEIESDELQWANYID